MKLIYILVSIFILWSCKTKPIQNKIENSSDTIVIHKVDTFRLIEKKYIETPVFDFIEIPCDSGNFKTEKQTSKTNFSVEKKSGIVRIKYKIDTLKNTLTSQKITKKDTIYRVKLKTSIIEKQIPQPFTPFWVKVLAWCGAIAIVYHSIKHFFI